MIFPMYDFDHKKDYYKDLGVSEDASVDEIKRAFKKLAVKYHPDKPGGDKSKFQEVNEAHGILSDEKKKWQYDAMRKGWYSGMWWGWYDFGWFQWGWFDFGGVDLGDLVGNMFWGGFWWGWSRSRKASKWEDIKHQLNITFEESFLGTEKRIEYTRYQRAKWVTETTCSECNGSGSRTQQVQTPFGVMQSQQTCNKCNWIWKIYEKDGKELPNGGLEQHKETLEVNIPTGIKDDVYIKYQNKWHAGLGDVPEGDLYIKINIIASNVFERKGNDIYVKKELTIYDLVLGGETEIPHPQWKLKVKIPKGTQIGDLIKIAWKGFEESGFFSKKGNLYIDPEIHIPKRLSKEQEKLWKELKKKA